MVDDNEKLTATIMPETASVQELKWTSTNPSVATVDEEGNVKAKAIGRTYITCKTTDGTEKSDICVVKVYDQYDVRDKIETEEITENSIKLKEVSGCEYKIGNGIWTTNTEFAGLEVDTEYEFSMRMAASGYHKASDVVTSKIKTSNHKLTAHEAVAASCTESGNSAYWSCDNCNKYFSDEKGETEIKKDSWIVAATGHVFDKNVAKDEYLKSAADCTHAAIYYKSCKCGEKGTETFVSGNPLNHDYKVVAGTAKEATCTEDGKEADQKCSRCEDVKVGATIKAKGHIEEIIPAVAATCTEKGKTAGKKCSVCNDILEAQKEIPAFGHKWDSGVITKAATATETGIKTYTCSVCKETKTETIPATGEQPAKPTEPPATDQGAKEDGVGTISADGKTLTDEDGTKYLVVEKVTTDQLNKNVSIADKKSGKYKITKVTKKKGKVTGGTVTYTKPYNKNCKTATVKDTVKIAGVKFNVTVIANNAFKDCEKLTKVTIGKKVTQIGKNAFNGCESLKTIIIKATNLKKVGANAFKDINSKAKFKLYKKKYSKYKKMIKRAKAPATAKYSK